MDRPLSIAMMGTRGVPARYGGFETAVEEIGQRLSRMGQNPSLLRAMGAGADVLAFDSTFSREVPLDQGRYFSRANDLVALLEAQEAVDEDTLESRATAARDRIRQVYNWDVVAAAYLKACR
jgi:glycosyltransferase involved in cell wall biosynthesis